LLGGTFDPVGLPNTGSLAYVRGPVSASALLDIGLMDRQGHVEPLRLPPGTYDFWPYRTTAEGQLLYETATEFAAPISLTVLTGENDATIRFQAR